MARKKKDENWVIVWVLSVLVFLCTVLEPFACIYLYNRFNMPPSQTIFAQVVLQSFRVLYWLTQYEFFFIQDFWFTMWMGFFNLFYVLIFCYVLLYSPLTSCLTIIYVLGPYSQSLGMAYLRTNFGWHLLLVCGALTSLVFISQPVRPFWWEWIFDTKKWLWRQAWQTTLFVGMGASLASFFLSGYHFLIMYNKGRPSDKEIIYTVSTGIGCVLVKAISGRKWQWDPIMQVDKPALIALGVMALAGSLKAVVPLSVPQTSMHKWLGLYTLIVPLAYFGQLQLQEDPPTHYTTWGCVTLFSILVCITLLRLLSQIRPDRVAEIRRRKLREDLPEVDGKQAGEPGYIPPVEDTWALLEGQQ